MTAARQYWNGVRMRTAHVTADPDDPTVQSVILPAPWDDEAACALLQLAPPRGPESMAAIRLTTEAGRWLAEMDALPAPASGKDLLPPGKALACLLLMRQLAPIASVWQGMQDRNGGFIVNLAAFVQDGLFATDAFIASIRLACDVLRRKYGVAADTLNGELPLFEALAPRMPDEETRTGPAGTLLLTNLDACLALLGMDYDSHLGRDAACALAWLASSLARQGAGPVPLPPASLPIPGLAEHAALIRDESGIAEDAPRHAPIETGFSSPGPVDALLGVESCGLTPIFSPLDAEGHLRPSTIARLAHRGFTPETALAAAMTGTSPISLPGPTAHQAMHRALNGFVDRMPARPDPLALPSRPARLERGTRRPLPARHGGFTQRASVGGHKLYLRTGEYEDGSIGEVSIVPARESAMVRGLLDSVGQAVTVGLQYGAPLDAYVARFAHTRFGPCGTVEGDPIAAYATSLLDYAFRALSEAYLGKRLPDAAPEAEPEAMEDPMLPLSMPEDSGTPRRRAGLRLVG
ncbi:TSCPD domain-containing protein [Brytella acorum]|uniref:ribonucleoside-diphosphate reductase n=1 Tax=Brytella acorum TaxID=2959299 RepID=A0AA35Y2Q3_9PROT|nr:vitamin B12-dependent ribonucleotide reductase [Brytella acorum]MDF3625629.1 vitamin B12-dependent ribonucleotide reductase [Brytella acorum]CAI9119494.1 vitamin B12-dependent ribonucleotide reductase [Brytella acorum]